MLIKKYLNYYLVNNLFKKLNFKLRSKHVKLDIKMEWLLWPINLFTEMTL